jgi:hypothetical protein
MHACAEIWPSMAFIKSARAAVGGKFTFVSSA